jgi:hypothetical protein
MWREKDYFYYEKNKTKQNQRRAEEETGARAGLRQRSEYFILSSFVCASCLEVSRQQQQPSE